MKFRSDRHINHDGTLYDPGIVDLPREVGERLGLAPVDGPTAEERDAEESAGKPAKNGKSKK